MDRLDRVSAHIRAIDLSVGPGPSASPVAASYRDWRWTGEGGSGQLFELRGCPAFVITPVRRAAGPIPWVWYAPTLLPGLPDTTGGGAEVIMFERFLKAGIAVAGIDAGESYGSPAGQEVFTALYDELTQKDGDVDHVQRFSRHPVLLGRSRGGLQTLAWAIGNPDRVGGWAGIYPVCDITSYPGLQKACSAFGMTEDNLQRKLDMYNPVSNIGTALGIPLFAIHGDVDELVPLDVNSGALCSHVEAAGGKMELIIAAGQGHNMWNGFFQCEELVQFVIGHAQQT
eukprot:COSAG02_NODE_8381_length_2591_cov_2.181380_2_plen_285_part_00